MFTKRKLTLETPTKGKFARENHYYNSGLAIDLGHDIIAAVLFQHLKFNICRMFDNGDVDENNEAWFGVSPKEIVHTLPEMTERMVVNAKNRLLKAKLIKQDSNNWKNKYTLTQKGLEYAGYQHTVDANNSSVVKKEEISQHEISPEVVEVISHLNKEIGRNRRPESKSSRQGIEHWLSEGYTVEELKAVIDVKKPQWINNKKTKRLLRAETLFNENYFESYLDEARDAGLLGPKGILKLTDEEIEKYARATDIFQYYRNDIDTFDFETQERIEAFYKDRGNK